MLKNVKIRNITKKQILVFAFAIWIVFSVGYIAYDQWQRFKIRYSQSAYKQGISDSIKTLMAQMEKCVVVPLYNGDKKVEAVSVECLNKVAKNSQKSDK